MAEESVNKKIQIWQTVVLVQFVIVIFLGLYASYQRATLASQTTYVVKVEQLLAEKDKREKELSAQLLTVMTLLQRAVNDLNQGQPTGVMNNAPVPAATK